MTEMNEFHPVQTQYAVRHDSQIPDAVTRRAYEVYCHVYGKQEAMVDLAGRGCRGGFSVGELFAFLYARSFPQAEWSARVDEAFKRPKP
jgi:hypothetical protein